MDAVAKAISSPETRNKMRSAMSNFNVAKATELKIRCRSKTLAEKSSPRPTWWETWRPPCSPSSRLPYLPKRTRRLAARKPEDGEI